MPMKRRTLRRLWRSMSTQRCQGYKCSFQWSFHWYLQALELLDGGSDYLGKGVSKAVGDEQKKKHW
ncbi:hypothetical protein BRARA_E01206 [Brassica rapa]|uniref:Uncharacterized protein n=1 Tax=Brassica campestris TaxID=3711 RepID=A0A397ZIB1_BRACM|nr:hypothetical protein BRARA_E01206 [Brassica rapa]